MNFIDVSTQFEDIEINIESELEHKSISNKPISSIGSFPYLVPNSQIQQAQ